MATSTAAMQPYPYSEFSCTLPHYLSLGELYHMQKSNCLRVEEAVRGSNTLGNWFHNVHGDDSQIPHDVKHEAALYYCNQSTKALKDGSTGDPYEATYLAVNAWGSVLMDGTVCCSLTHPPYCQSNSLNVADFALPVLLLPFLCLFCSGLVKTWREFVRQVVHPGVKDEPRVDFSVQQAPPPPKDDLERRLKAMWDSCCLHALPEAQEWGLSVVSTFMALRQRFDFQSDNVRNQLDHFISLWRSHCAVVVDREIQDTMEKTPSEEMCSGIWGELTDTSGLTSEVWHGLHHAAVRCERSLLQDGLNDLHYDLLEGFHVWREELRIHRAPDVPPLQRPHGAFQLRQPPGSNPEKASFQLTELIMYLLVWGESGNLRFMPEVVYFLTELALAADDDGHGMYKHARRGASGLFLAQVVRPIYNVIFDEWYTGVKVDEGGRDKAGLIEEYRRFLPADVANYDDWNELFNDPHRLVTGVLMDDESHLFGLPHRERFAALCRVDWHSTLAAKRVKTHREVHSGWGVFASLHRVVLVHVLLFGAAWLSGTHIHTISIGQFGARSRGVRFASLGLFSPMYGLALGYARWEIRGAANVIHGDKLADVVLSSLVSRSGLVQIALVVIYAAPALTFIRVKQLDCTESMDSPLLFGWLTLHYSISALGYGIGLFLPMLGLQKADLQWGLSRETVWNRVGRYLFWTCVLGTKTTLSFIFCISKMQYAVYSLGYGRVPIHSDHLTMGQVFNPAWSKDVMQEFALTFVSLFLFMVDTQLWFVMGCTVIGVCKVFAQHSCRIAGFVFANRVSNIPETFSEKVLPYARLPPEDASAGNPNTAPAFLQVWDRIIEWLRYECKISTTEMGNLSFNKEAPPLVRWETLQKPLGGEHGQQWGQVRKIRYHKPRMFESTKYAENLLRRISGMGKTGWPENREARWRLATLARGLSLPIPRPYRAPYIPGITVLIPHYGEPIIAVKETDLMYQPLKPELNPAPLMDWLVDKYTKEFDDFGERMGQVTQWTRAGTDWENYRDAHWPKLAVWASMRQQTLFCTVAGMTKYHQALQCHFEAQGDARSTLGKEWKVEDCVTILVSMQMYKHFTSTKLEHTDKMFDKFPDSLKVAFVDHDDPAEEPGHFTEAVRFCDNLHPQQVRRYFSSLIHKDCAKQANGQRKPFYRVELPGWPIMGDGKGDNQNQAIIYSRGSFVQCIDANQGAFFEQMLLLPCALAEFRTKRPVPGRPRDGGQKRIVGFPEKITSDFGSVGNFAATAEFAFGTILQRAYTMLGARMHYGHPDMMNKEFMMQQGGVSKATKTLNLSEDIFAGMDFVLRGRGRRIAHSEYFSLTKGRDLGFNTVLLFFMKLSSGCGEQLLTRQTMRLGQLLPLPEFLSFYYAHMGHYISQWLISNALPLLVQVWLLIILQGCEQKHDVNFECNPAAPSPAAIMASVLQTYFYGALIFLFVLAQMSPMFLEICLEEGILMACTVVIQQVLTFSPIMFIFQSKVIGVYVMNELRYGGATYLATGRGLPVDRRPFIASCAADGTLEWKKGGLYLDYARIAFYDGAFLLLFVIMLACAAGTEAVNGQTVGIFICLALVITSWLLGPFIFNPYQFFSSCFIHDLRAFVRFFFEDGGRYWDLWFHSTQVTAKRGFRHSFLDMQFGFECFWLTLFFASLNARTRVLYYLSSSFAFSYHFIVLPPVFLPLLLCFTLAIVSAAIRGRRRRKLRADAEDSGSESSTTTASTRKLPEDIEAGRLLPLSVVSAVILLVTIAEAVLPLYTLLVLGWRKAFMNGILVKIFWVRLTHDFLMAVSRSKAIITQQGPGGLALETARVWLHAMCFARDLIVSSLIFWSLAPFVLLSRMLHCLCPNWSFHHLLVYRQPGHAARETIDVDVLPSGSSSDVEGTTPYSGESGDESSVEDSATPVLRKQEYGRFRRP